MTFHAQNLYPNIKLNTYSMNNYISISTEIAILPLKKHFTSKPNTHIRNINFSFFSVNCRHWRIGVHTNGIRISRNAIISGNSIVFVGSRQWRPLAARRGTATPHVLPTRIVSFPLYFRTGFLSRAQAPLTFFKPRPCFCNFYRAAHL